MKKSTTSGLTLASILLGSATLAALGYLFYTESGQGNLAHIRNKVRYTLYGLRRRLGMYRQTRDIHNKFRNRFAEQRMDDDYTPPPSYRRTSQAVHT